MEEIKIMNNIKRQKQKKEKDKGKWDNWGRVPIVPFGTIWDTS